MVREVCRMHGSKIHSVKKRSVQHGKVTGTIFCHVSSAAFAPCAATQPRTCKGCSLMTRTSCYQSAPNEMLISERGAGDSIDKV